MTRTHWQHTSERPQQPSGTRARTSRMTGERKGTRRKHKWPTVCLPPFRMQPYHARRPTARTAYSPTRCRSAKVDARSRSGGASATYAGSCSGGGSPRLRGMWRAAARSARWRRRPCCALPLLPRWSLCVCFALGFGDRDETRERSLRFDRVRQCVSPGIQNLLSQISLLRLSRVQEARLRRTVARF